MSQLKIEIKLQSEFPLPAKALTFLQQAEENSPFSFFTPEIAITLAQKGIGCIAIVSCGNEVLGCFSYGLREFKDRRHLVLTSLGGENIKLWSDALVAFLFKIASEHHCTDFSMMGPRAWGRMFPQLKEISCVFGRSLI